MEFKFGCCSLVALSGLSGPCPEMSPPCYHHWPSELQELGLQASVTNRDQGKRCFSPHSRVGFLFLVLYPVLLLLLPSLPPSLARSLARSLTHSLTHPPTHPTLCFCVPGVGHGALPRGWMYLRCPLVSAAFAWQAWDNVHCQGVGCTPWRPSGVPWSPPLLRGRRGGVGQRALPRGRMYALASLRCPLVSASFAWQAWDNVHCQGVRCTPWRPSGVPWSPPLLRGRRGTTCTAKGSDVRPGVPPVSLGLRCFRVAGVGQRALPRGRMYVLASLRCPLVSAAFAWQAWDNVHCQGVGCTPWRPSGVPWSPPLLRGRRGTMCILRGRRGAMCIAKGSDVRPGVRWHSLTHSLTLLTRSLSLTHTH